MAFLHIYAKKMCRSQFLMIALFWSIFLSYSLSLIKAPQDEMVYIGSSVNIWLVWDRLLEVEVGSGHRSSECETISTKHFCTEVCLFFSPVVIYLIFMGILSSCQSWLTIQDKKDLSKSTQHSVLVLAFHNVAIDRSEQKGCYIFTIMRDLSLHRHVCKVTNEDLTQRHLFTATAKMSIRCFNSLFLGYREGSIQHILWNPFRNSNKTILFIYVWFFPLVALSVTFSYQIWNI